MTAAPRELRDYQLWAVVAMDGSGRYAATDDWTAAGIYLRDHAKRNPGRTFVLMVWNGPQWREKGHWQEYAERTFGQAHVNPVQA